MKVTKDKTETITLTVEVSPRELELLTGLADFPLHSAQSEEIMTFLETLYEQLRSFNPSRYHFASIVGYKPFTSV